GWTWPKGSRSPLVPLPDRCVLAPGTCVPVWCAHAPDLRRTKIGTRVPLPSRTVRAYLLPTPPRDRTGKYLGRRSRNWKRTLDGGGSDQRSRIRITSRVTGHRPTGLVTVGAAAVIGIHRRHGRLPVSGGDLAFPAGFPG